MCALGLAGCGGRTHHDAHPNASAQPSASTSAQQDTASPESLPDGFPADVPVVKGTIEGTHTDIPGSGGKVWKLTVTGADTGAFDTAQQQLSNAGFTRDDTSAGSDTPIKVALPCDQPAQFSKDRADGGGYIVMVCDGGSETAVDYTVNVYPKALWGTGILDPSNLPQIPAPPDLGEPPHLGG